ncbi:hypothetical protein AB0B10_24950 [Micromonospora arborensis]|uniref:hypothetical protein n=1 Tax=Micromonospora arborensis TaxID=2116518 RepID=UPI0033EC50FA
MGRSRRHRPAPKPTEVDEAPQPGPWWRRWPSKLWAGLLASGLIAAVAPVLVTQNIGGLSDRFQQALGSDALRVHVTARDELSPGPFRIWALESGLGPDGTIISNPADMAGLLTSGRAVSLVESTHEVTVENMRRATATITSIRAVPLRRLPPLAGAVVDARTGGGPGEGPIELRFDLDDLDAAARDNKGARYLDDAGLLLTAGETLRFRIVGQSTRAYVEWDIEIGFIASGAQGAVRAAGNAPFRTTAVSPTYAEHYVWSPDGLRASTAAELCGTDCRSLTS